MTPISIRRAFDPELHHALEKMQDEHPTKEGLVGILVSAVVMGSIFAFVMWLEPFTRWIERMIGL